MVSHAGVRGCCLGFRGRGQGLGLSGQWSLVRGKALRAVRQHPSTLGVRDQGCRVKGACIQPR